MKKKKAVAKTAAARPKKAAAAAAKPVIAAAPAAPAAAISEDEILIRDAVQLAVSEDDSLPPPQARARPAKLAVRRGGKPDAPVTERDKIIQQALAIQRVQSRLLDDLDPKLKEKVRRMAVDLMVKPSRKPDA